MSIPFVSYSSASVKRRMGGLVVIGLLLTIAVAVFLAMPGVSQEMVVRQKQDELSFLPRLSGGLIIHIPAKQKPMVLFSEEPCP